MRKSVIVKSLIVLTIAIIVIIIVLNYVKNEEEKRLQDGSNVRDDDSKINNVEVNGVVKYVNTKSEYYLVKSVIEEYFIDSDNIINYNSISNSEFFNLFSNVYTNEYSLDLNNIKEKISKSGCTTVRIDKLYRVLFENGPMHYFAYGYAINEEKNIKEEFSMIVLVDNFTENTAILLEDYMKDHNYLNIELNSEISMIQSKVENDNKYLSKHITEEEYVSDMFNEFRKDCLYYPERAYRNLTDIIKEKEFNSYDEFKKYIDDNTRKILLMEFGTYLRESVDGKTVYMCSTTDGEIYTFYTDSVMNYKVEF